MLKKIREECHLAPIEMAQLMGITTVGNYTRIESGVRRPTKQQEAAAKMIHWMYYAGELGRYLAQLQTKREKNEIRV